MKVCDKCGYPNQDDDMFCLKCGHMIGFVGNKGAQPNNPPKPQPQQPQQSNYPPKPQPPRNVPSPQGNTVFDTLNNYMGNSSNAPLNWKDLFTNVFKKHTSQEAEDLFIYGTRRTTPPLYAVSSDWPKPWLYSRVLLGLVVTFFLLKLAVDIFSNPNAIPGVIFIGSMAFPVAMAFLFMEINVFRNISFYKTALVFLIGGAASLLLTLLLYAFVLPDMHELGLVEALLIGIIEETGKFFIIFFFIKKLPNCNFILDGLLVGALVGAGFAAFESAGYAFGCLLEDDLDAMYSNIYLRGFLSPGGHVAWSAMVGAAIILGKGQSRNILDMGTILSNNRFWKIVIIPILLHFLWDCPLMSDLFIKYIFLIVVAWVITLILIQMGLQEVNAMTHRNL